MVFRRLRKRITLDLRILEAVSEFNQLELPAFGYAVAKELRVDGGRLISHGALYRCFDRAIERGLLETRWETDAGSADWPPRRVYRITPAGSVVLADGSMRSVAAEDRSWLAPRR